MRVRSTDDSQIHFSSSNLSWNTIFTHPTAHSISPLRGHSKFRCSNWSHHLLSALFQRKPACAGQRYFFGSFPILNPLASPSLPLLSISTTGLISGQAITIFFINHCENLLICLSTTLLGALPSFLHKAVKSSFKKWKSACHTSASKLLNSSPLLCGWTQTPHWAWPTKPFPFCSCLCLPHSTVYIPLHTSTTVDFFCS